jgi:hypothetical protein
MIGLLETYLRTKASIIVDKVIERGAVRLRDRHRAAELPLQAIAELMGVPRRTATSSSTGRTA